MFPRGAQCVRLYTESGSPRAAPHPTSAEPRQRWGRSSGSAALEAPLPGGGARTPISSLLRRQAPAPGAAVPAGFADPCARPAKLPAPGPALCPGFGGGMGGARDAGWVAAGLLLGAGACYCIYRLTRGQRRGGRGLRLRPSRSAGEVTGCPAGSGDKGPLGVGVEDAAGARGYPVLQVQGAQAQGRPRYSGRIVRTIGCV